MTVEFRLLGDLQVRIRGRIVDMGHARQRSVLVALVVEANRTVPVGVLLDRVWTDRLPQRARNALSGYVSRIRHLLSSTDEVRIARLPDGYRLTVAADSVDLHRFHRLVAEARACPDDEGAVRLFEEALGLWHGDAFGGMDCPWLDGLRASLDAQRFAVELDRNDLALRCGRHEVLQSELSARSAAYPLDERLAGQAMLALFRCGRQAQALQRYEKLRHSLAEALGADPGPPLQQLYKQILTANPALTPATAGDREHAGEDTPVPCQLPAAPRAFTGRAAQLAALDALLGHVVDDRPSTVVISAVSGTAGVGKTALAVHWGHRVAESFVDGQLYVNLRGYDPSGSMSAAEAIRGFLDALGVPPQRIPGGLDAQAALYRSLLAGRRMLVVLDNARDAEHARPLIPGKPGCMVMVTSRNALTGLVAAEGAHAITLDLMTSGEAHDLLTARLGAPRVQAEPDAAGEIITRCSRLPLPLTIMAARAVTRPGFALSALADELGTGTALDVLDAADPRTSLRAVFSWSYRTLSEPAAKLFRLLGMHPGPDISVSAAASLVALPVARTRALLAELTRDHLLAEEMPGRFGLHDLLRDYAIEQNRLSDAEPERIRAAHRLLYHYLHTARAAAMQASPTRDPITIGAPPPGVILEEPADPDSAMAWFTREHHVLLAAIGLAQRAGFETYVWQLAWTMTTFLDRRGHWNDWVQTGLAAAAAARKLDDPVEQARAHRYTARAYTRLDRLADAHAQLERALELYRDSVDRVGLAEAHLRLGQVLDRQGRQAKALEHAIEALHLFRAAGWLAGEAAALNAVGWYQALLGDFRQALVSCGDALPRLQELGDRQGQADTFDSLGYVHHHLGQQSQAVASYRNAIKLYRELGDRYDESVSLGYLGDAHHAAGEKDAAAAAWRQALSILDDLCHPEAESVRRKLES